MRTTNLILSLGLLVTTVASACGTTHTPGDSDGGGIIILPDGASRDASSVPDAGALAACPDGTPLGDYGGKPLIEVRIDESETLSFVLIPSSTTAVDADVLGGLGDGPHVIHAGGVDIEAATLFPFDASLLGLPGVHGILGGDVIDTRVVNIDPMRGRFWLTDAIDDAALRACAHVEGDPIEAELMRFGADWVRGRIEDRDGWLGVGIGTSLGVVTEATFAALDERAPRPSLGGFYTPTGAGTFFSRMSSIGSYDVSGKRVAHVLARTVPDGFLAPSPASPDGAPVLGVLPADFLEHFVISLDAARGVLRLDGYLGDPREEPSRFFPIGIALADTEGTPVEIAEVLAGSAADEAGVHPGDVLVAIDGRRMTAITPYERSFALGAGFEGERIEIEIEQDGAPRTVTLETQDLLTSPTTE
jgi:hypothetical protein